jgi:hypothetical protein
MDFSMSASVLKENKYPRAPLDDKAPILYHASPAPPSPPNIVPLERGCSLFYAGKQSALHDENPPERAYDHA